MLLFFAFCNASPVFLPLICMLQVSGASTGYKPSNGQYQIYNTTFGYLTVQPGYCSGRTCHVFPAINDEFGCVLDGRSLASIDDRSFGDDMNVLGYTHEALHRCMRGAQCCCVAAPPPFYCNAAARARIGMSAAVLLHRCSGWPWHSLTVRQRPLCARRSTFGDIAEAQCFQGIVDWMNVAAGSKHYPHGRMTSWFYWAYNPDSGGATCFPCLQVQI